MSDYLVFKKWFIKNKTYFYISGLAIWFFHWLFFVDVKIEVLPYSILGSWRQNDAFGEVEDPKSIWFGEKEIRIPELGTLKIKKILHSKKIGGGDKGLGQYEVYGLRDGRRSETVLSLILTEAGLLYVEEVFDVSEESEEKLKIGIFHKVSS
jgi:hypothetical protein